MAREITIRGREKMMIRIFFWRLLICSLLSRGKGVSMTAENGQFYRKMVVFDSLKKSVIISEILEK